MRALLETVFFPFMVSQKLWWILVFGIGLSLLIKIGMHYQLAKLHAQTAGTLLCNSKNHKKAKSWKARL